MRSLKALFVVTVACCLLALVGPALALTKGQSDPRGDAPAPVDVTHATYSNTGKWYRVTLHIRDVTWHKSSYRLAVGLDHEADAYALFYLRTYANKTRKLSLYLENREGGRALTCPRDHMITHFRTNKDEVVLKIQRSCIPTKLKTVTMGWETQRYYKLGKTLTDDDDFDLSVRHSAVA